MNEDTGRRIRQANPGLQTCTVCGDIDQPEYQHFTSEHTGEPEDGLTLIAGVLYDEDGYEADDSTC